MQAAPSCPQCASQMRPLLTSFFCPNDCDKTTEEVAAEFPLPNVCRVVWMELPPSKGNNGEWWASPSLELARKQFPKIVLYEYEVLRHVGSNEWERTHDGTNLIALFLMKDTGRISKP